MTNRQLEVLKKKYLREGYKMALKEMAFSPSFSKDAYYSGMEDRFNKKKAGIDSEFQRRRDALEREYQEQMNRSKNFYQENIDKSEMAEKIAEALPCMIDDMNSDSPSTIELIVNDERCPFTSILIKFERNNNVKWKCFGYKNHLFVSARSNNIKPFYKDLDKLMASYDSYSLRGKAAPVALDQAPQVMSDAITKIMKLYTELKQEDGSANTTKGNITPENVKDMLVDGRKISWEDIFYHLSDSDTEKFIAELANLINTDFGGNAPKSLLNADNWDSASEEAVYEEGGGDYDDGVEIIEREGRLSQFGWYNGTYIFVKKAALKKQ